MYLNLFVKPVKADATLAVTTTNTEGASGSEIDAERVERGRKDEDIDTPVPVGGGGASVPEFIAGRLGRSVLPSSFFSRILS